MDSVLKINIAKDYSEFPWARYRQDGEFSGEEFFEKFFGGLEKLDKVIIDLDGTYWYPSSFLSEVFWRFYDKYGTDGWNKLEFVSNEDPSLPGFIYRLIRKNEA